MDAKELGRLAMNGDDEEGRAALEALAQQAISKAWVEPFEEGSVNSLINKDAASVVMSAMELVFYSGVEMAARAIYENRKVSENEKS